MSHTQLLKFMTIFKIQTRDRTQMLHNCANNPNSSAVIPRAGFQSRGSLFFQLPWSQLKQVGTLPILCNSSLKNPSLAGDKNPVISLVQAFLILWLWSHLKLAARLLFASFPSPQFAGTWVPQACETWCVLGHVSWVTCPPSPRVLVSLKSEAHWKLMVSPRQCLPVSSTFLIHSNSNSIESAFHSHRVCISFCCFHLWHPNYHFS